MEVLIDNNPEVPDLQVLGQHLDLMEIAVDGSTMSFSVGDLPASSDDALAIVFEAIRIGALCAHSQTGDWDLERIEAYVPTLGKKVVTFWISSNETIAEVSEGTVGLDKVLQVQMPDEADTSAAASCSNGCSEPSPTCVIKGNIEYEGTDKIYHLPECEDYAATVINSAYGERWFCTEAEAKANGWRKARNCL